FDFLVSTGRLNRPCVESYFTRYPRLSAGTTSLTATTSSSLPRSPCSTRARNTSRPIRPNPLIPTFTAAIVVVSPEKPAGAVRGAGPGYRYDPAGRPSLPREVLPDLPGDVGGGGVGEFASPEGEVLADHLLAVEQDRRLGVRAEPVVLDLRRVDHREDD